MNTRLDGVYAITPDGLETAMLADLAAAAIEGGVCALQYRSKHPDAAFRRRQLAALVPLCRAASVPLIVNDSVELALAADVDGVHLGRDDGDPVEARRRLGAGRLLGVSCYDDFELAVRYGSAADHIAFGSVFDSPTKPAAVRAPLELFARARARGWNTVAIGGITADNAPAAYAAGADAIAVISALFDPGVRAWPDDRAAARRAVLAAARGLARPVG